MKKIILASGSPRRRELMKYLQLDFEVVTSNVEEVINPKLEHDELVMDLAFQKAYDVFKNHKDSIVLGFDTLVVIDDYVLGKPKNEEEAKIYLKLLSGNTHRVLTGCTILTSGYSKSFYSFADVTFNKLTETEIDEYIKTAEPMDKAGAYGIQGYGSRYIKAFNGDYFTIVGLPVSKLYNELNKILNKA